MGWVIFAICVLFFFGYLFFIPFKIEIDSTQGFFRFRFPLIVTVSLIVDDISIFIELTVIGLKRKIDLLKIKKSRNKSNKEKIIKRKRRIPFTKIFSVIRSFRLKQFILRMDTGDLEWNGFLYPVFYFFSEISGREFNINYYGKNELKVKIENSFARILWAYLKV